MIQIIDLHFSVVAFLSVLKFVQTFSSKIVAVRRVDVADASESDILAYDFSFYGRP
jgi:hypothetical protein